MTNDYLLPVISVDWDHSKVTVFDGESVEEYATLDELLDALSEPTFITIKEATFESFDLERRYAFMDRCRGEGHTLRTVTFVPKGAGGASGTGPGEERPA